MEQTKAWLHLADCLKSARNGRRLRDVVDGSGVSVRQILAYESGKEYRRPPDKMWQLVNYYGWTPDSLRRVLDGELPTYMPAAVPRTLPTVNDEQHAAFMAMLDSTRLSKREKEKIRREIDELPRAPAAVKTA